MRQIQSSRYLIFLSASLVATLVLYSIARSISGLVALFLVITIGNAHYILAYLANMKRWRQLPASMRKKRLLIWLAIGLLYTIIFYALKISFAWTLFSIIVIAAVHILRDYGFFFSQIISGRGERSLALTVFLSGIYLGFLFLILAVNPDKIPFLFLYHLPINLFYIGLGISIGGILIGGYSVARRLLFLLILPIIGLLFLQQINPVDYVYSFVLWHFILWLFFTYQKTSHAAVGLFQNRKKFLLISSVIHILGFAVPFMLLKLDFWSSFSELAYGSLIFGLYGYPLWSFLHISFTSFRPVTKI